MKVFSSYFLLMLIAVPCVISVFENKGFAYAEDATEEDLTDDEATVDSTDGEQTTEEEDAQTQGSPDIDLTILFTRPEGNGLELPAGKPVEFLIGVTNNGEKDYVVDAADVSFKYPLDHAYTVQNFSAAVYNKALKPRQEATVFYNFLTSEQFAGRPLGLIVNLAYHDAEGEDFIETVFNSTVTIVEVDEGLDGETFFLYVFLLAFLVLMLLAGHQFLTYMGVSTKKAPSKTSSTSSSSTSSTGASKVEVGTKNGVDYDWLPEHVQSELKKTNGATRTSPRLRKA